MIEIPRRRVSTTSTSPVSDLLKSFSSRSLRALAAVSFESDVAIWLAREEISALGLSVFAASFSMAAFRQ